jgi:Putative prokaryotic signal transducing protein
MAPAAKTPSPHGRARRSSSDATVLVTVANFTEPWEAHMFRTRLQAEGILAFVAHDQHVGNDGFIATALGGVKVQVTPDDVDAARAIERDCRAGRYRAELEAAFGQEAEHCPNCASVDFTTGPSQGHIAAAAVALVAGGAFPTLGESIRWCRQCGTRWDRQLPE